MAAETSKSFLVLFFKKERSSFCLAACLLAAACSAPRAAPPLDPLIPPDLHFTLSDGATLPARAWLPAPGTPWRGIVLALHGFDDSRDAWELSAPVFATAGYAFYAPDQRGFGEAPGRGTWPGTTQLVADAAELATQLHHAHPGAPLIIFGESMGGAVALLLAARPDTSAYRFVLLAPAVLGWQQIPWPAAAALRIADAVAPGWAPDPTKVAQDILASDNIQALIRIGRDPLTIRNPSIAATSGLVDLMTEAQRAVPALHGNVLILSGRRDQLVPSYATHAAWSRLPPTVRRAFYPHGYHLLLRDTDRALVQADILAWLANPDAWLPSAADAATAAWDSDHAWQPRRAPLPPAALLDHTGARPIWPY